MNEWMNGWMELTFHERDLCKLHLLFLCWQDHPSYQRPQSQPLKSIPKNTRVSKDIQIPYPFEIPTCF